ncbi:lactoylglutathione lyase [Weissella viridescens]|uniref:Lactoylglutathione lyase n=1 Tax=Weissella viridescens TaxID=1629 RepID=A0A3P2R984_WEIVI|nr:lactoylglutathione lyase [Weissella viridescens]RRG17377.1 lactoylglutathione lyase [Weissella viridescens]
MRVSSFSTFNIPVENLDRAVRFYREVFDLPSTFSAHEQSHLSFQGNPLVFEPAQGPIQPITLTIAVQDTPQAIENHLINYDVPQIALMTTDNGASVFHIADFEGNHINLSTQK